MPIIDGKQVDYHAFIEPIETCDCCKTKTTILKECKVCDKFVCSECLNSNAQTECCISCSDN